jgi:predicted dehydrogenase
MNRRKFIGLTSAGISTAMIIPRHVLGGRGFTAPSDKLNIAGIGIGGQGAWDLQNVETENITALCDVDWQYAAEIFARYPKAKKYRDYRIMFEREKEIDAVVVATPDHMHAPVTMAALRKGKHVYCEKPLTHTIYEAREIAKAARAANVATQMGNQGMAFEGNFLLNEWIWDGAIGDITEVHVWSDRPTRLGTRELWWRQGVERSQETPPVPDTLDWNLWLGPAPWRPYHTDYVPFHWRGWWDFGEGGLGDMGIHNVVPAFLALKLTAPVSVHGSSTPVFEETLPKASVVHYNFPAREDMPPVKLHWYDGGMMPERPEELEDSRELSREDGMIFVGSKGKIYVEGWGGQSPRIIPEAKMQDYKLPPKSLERSIGHHAEWIKACKEGTPTRSNFQFASLLTETVLLGTLCIRLGGKKLAWDSQNLTITTQPEANNYLHYQYRSGYRL